MTFLFIFIYSAVVFLLFFCSRLEARLRLFLHLCHSIYQYIKKMFQIFAYLLLLGENVSLNVTRCEQNKQSTRPSPRATTITTTVLTVSVSVISVYLYQLRCLVIGKSVLWAKIVLNAHSANACLSIPEKIWNLNHFCTGFGACASVCVCSWMYLCAAFWLVRLKQPLFVSILPIGLLRPNTNTTTLFWLFSTTQHCLLLSVCCGRLSSNVLDETM